MTTNLIPLDRLLPQDKDAEMAVLGAILLAPVDVLPLVRDRLDANSFYFASHQTIYTAILNSPTPDMVLLTGSLQTAGKLDEIGGAAYLADLVARVPTTANAEYYIDRVEEKARLRALIGTTYDILTRAFDTDDVPAFLDAAEKNVLAVTAAANGKTQGRDMQDGSKVFMDRLASRLDVETNGVTGIPTGLGLLDKCTTGLHPLLYLIAGRPGSGKTVLLENMARACALEAGQPVAFFSLEMSLEELMERTYSAVANVPSMALRTGQINAEEHARVIAAHPIISQMKMFVEDEGGRDILDIRRRARWHCRRHGVKAIFIDYAQLIKSGSKKGMQNEVWELNEVSQGLKNLQKELGIAVVVAAQLGRDVEKRGDNAKPRLSDIKSCGAFEQDADAVLMIMRDSYNDDPAVRSRADLYITKQRHGPTGKIPLYYHEEFYRFASAVD